MREKIVLRKNPDMVTRTIAEETILLPIYRTSDEINCIYTLNRVASRVWEMIDGRRRFGEIRKQILSEFDATTGEVDKQIEKFLKDLKQIKAIV